jgi:hypothetical protein
MTKQFIQSDVSLLSRFSVRNINEHMLRANRIYSRNVFINTLKARRLRVQDNILHTMFVHRITILPHKTVCVDDEANSLRSAAVDRNLSEAVVRPCSNFGV